jgi:hypothetical protein
VALVPAWGSRLAIMWCVKTTKPEAAAAARIGARAGARKRRELLCLLRPCFARAEPSLQAGKYVDALVSGLPKRNGWTIAEHAGDRAPGRTQRLLNLVRAENLVHGSDQQSCPFGAPGVMISDHVPAVRVPPYYAGRHGVAAVAA